MKHTRFWIASGMAVSLSSAHADSVVVMHVDLKNPPAASTLRIPSAGDYTFRTSQHKVRADLPDGTSMIFDYDAKKVTQIDPAHKTYCEMKLGDYLAIGEKVSPGIAKNFGASTRVTLDPLVGQESIQMLNHDVDLYNVYLGSHIDPNIAPEDKSDKPKKGVSQPQDTNAGAPGIPTFTRPTSYGVEVAGALWLGTFQIDGADRGDLADAECETILRGSPGLRILADRLRKQNLTLMGGDLSVSILDVGGNQPAAAPTLSLQTKFISTGPATDFTVPKEYKKMPVPVLSLGEDQAG